MNSGGSFQCFHVREVQGRTISATFAHNLGPIFWGGWQGRGVTSDRLMTLWIHSCMVTQCDSPDMAGNGRQLRSSEPHLRLQTASKN